MLRAATTREMLPELIYTRHIKLLITLSLAKSTICTIIQLLIQPKARNSSFHQTSLILSKTRLKQLQCIILLNPQLQPVSFSPKSLTVQATKKSGKQLNCSKTTFPPHQAKEPQNRSIWFQNTSQNRNQNSFSHSKSRNR